VSFLQPFCSCLAAFTGGYLIGDVFDRFDDLVHYKGFGAIGLEYFLLKLPLIVSQLLPLACLAGVLLGFAILNRSGQVLACQSLGISRLEMAAPLLLIAALISAANFGLNETLVPFTTRQAREIYNVQLKKRQMLGVFFNRWIWMRVRGGFLSVDSYDVKTAMLKRVKIFRLDPEYGLQDVMNADSAHWNGQRWTLQGVNVLKIDQNGTVTSVGGGNFVLDVKPADFGMLRQDPEEFSLGELNRYLHQLRKKGLDPGGYVVDRDLKYATPISCLIMVALGVALSIDPMPRNQPMARSFGLAIVIGFAYWLVLGFSSSFGRSGFVPAWLAAWLPNVIFASIAASIFLFGEER
jgi:lipopolysaccharide export system permease protein